MIENADATGLPDGMRMREVEMDFKPALALNVASGFAEHWLTEAEVQGLHDALGKWLDDVRRRREEGAHWR